MKAPNARCPIIAHSTARVDLPDQELDAYTGAAPVCASTSLGERSKSCAFLVTTRRIARSASLGIEVYSTESCVRSGAPFTPSVHPLLVRRSSSDSANFYCSRRSLTARKLRISVRQLLRGTKTVRRRCSHEHVPLADQQRVAKPHSRVHDEATRKRPTTR